MTAANEVIVAKNRNGKLQKDSARNRIANLERERDAALAAARDLYWVLRLVDDVDYCLCKAHYLCVPCRVKAAISKYRALVEG